MDHEARAAVFVGPGQPMRLQRFALPQLGDSEALVRVHLATICGSDLHSVEGRRSVPCPTILGHEILGSIETLPANLMDITGQPLRAGDRVVWSMMVHCGSCFFCTHGLPQKCDRLFKYGHEAITPHHALSGGLATHCHLKRGTALMRVPPSLPDAVVCPASCATATIAAALRHAGDLADAVVLIHGAGMLGLTAAAWASVRGARAILLCDLRNDRLAAGRRFGATHVFQIGDSSDSLPDAVRGLTQNRGVDVALELSGATAAAQAGLESLRMGGRAVWVGAVFPGAPVELTMETVVRRHVSIHGVHNYRPDDLIAAVEFLTAHHKRFPFAELVSTPFALDDVEAALAFARQGSVFRVAISGGRDV
jgi:putative phosphonate catabolism associated alcohol dehydrogenase